MLHYIAQCTSCESERRPRVNRYNTSAWVLIWDRCKACDGEYSVKKYPVLRRKPGPDCGWQAQFNWQPSRWHVILYMFPPSEAKTQTEMRRDEKISDERVAFFLSLSHHASATRYNQKRAQRMNRLLGMRLRKSMLASVSSAVSLLFLFPRVPSPDFYIFYLNGTLSGALGAYQWDKSIFYIVSKEGMRTAGDKSFLPQGTKHNCSRDF